LVYFDSGGCLTGFNHRKLWNYAFPFLVPAKPDKLT
jgi:hypothetical protein